MIRCLLEHIYSCLQKVFFLDLDGAAYLSIAGVAISGRTTYPIQLSVIIALN